MNAKLAKQNGIANEGNAEHLAAVTGAVTVPAVADISRIAKELKVDSTAVFDRVSNAVTKGPVSGQKTDEAGHGHGQTSLQKLKDGKEKGIEKMIARGTCLESITNNGSIFPNAGVLVEQVMFQVIASTNQQMDTV